MIIGVITFIFGFLLSTTIALLHILDLEEELFENEEKVAKAIDYTNVVVRSDFEISTLDVLTTIQGILGDDK